MWVIYHCKGDVTCLPHKGVHSGASQKSQDGSHNLTIGAWNFPEKQMVYPKFLP